MAVDKAAYHFDKLYSYAIPVEFAATLRPGMRVLVPFGGGNRKRQGIVLGRKPVQSLEKLKPLVSILDSEPVLSPELLRLVSFLKRPPSVPISMRSKQSCPAALAIGCGMITACHRCGTERRNR